jgi:hypothetical protein
MKRPYETVPTEVLEKRKYALTLAEYRTPRILTYADYLMLQSISNELKHRSENK